MAKNKYIVTPKGISKPSMTNTEIMGKSEVCALLNKFELERERYEKTLKEITDLKNKYRWRDVKDELPEAGEALFTRRKGYKHILQACLISYEPNLEFESMDGEVFTDCTKWIPESVFWEVE